jgi:hypothetical protein
LPPPPRGRPRRSSCRSRPTKGAAVPELRYNLITFRPAGGGSTRIALDLPSITRRGGLEMDVWSAIVPYTALATIGLGDVTAEMPGTVELWYTNAPGTGAADVTLDGCAILDVEPAAWGEVDGVHRAYEYRVSIGDRRRAWAAPRGGLLLDGRINPDPPPDPDTELLSSAELIVRCCDAMGVNVTIPNSVNVADLPRELDWSCEHAPTALQALLEHCGHVCAPLISGHVQIVRPGSAFAPTIPAGRLVSDVTIKSVDRRGSAVVFISAPAASGR